MSHVRIVFMGSPDFALPSLQAMAGAHELVGVVTQPDRPAGRGRELRPPPVKLAAAQLGLPVLQPPRISAPEAMEQLHAWAPDLIIVAAFGQILRPTLLALPHHGCINVHASLLPRWRGAAPVPAAILNGDPATGISIMRMDAGVDTGPILAQEQIAILPGDTTGSLLPRLAQLGARLLASTLPDYLAGRHAPRRQDDSQATVAPVIHKSDGALDLNHPAEALERRVRAFDPWPGSFVYWGARRLAVRRVRVAPAGDAPPGRATVVDGLPAAGTGHGLLVFEILQPEGREAMKGQDFLRGARGFAGSLLTKTPGDEPQPAPAPPAA
ncbi:MAG: methionyl-tRNA formyltransferase [Chloroflexi bacterium RBG_13_68_17]|nr:MAG: methionyl-tRNA formyltransferase [Chloroflexi bacterium RBG_13_68_17]